MASSSLSSAIACSPPCASASARLCNTPTFRRVQRSSFSDTDAWSYKARRELVERHRERHRDAGGGESLVLNAPVTHNSESPHPTLDHESPRCSTSKATYFLGTEAVDRNTMVKTIGAPEPTTAAPKKKDIAGSPAALQPCAVPWQQPPGPLQLPPRSPPTRKPPSPPTPVSS